MNFKLTLALVIVLLLIASLFVAVQNRKPAVKPDENATTPLFDPSPADLTALSYSRDGKQQIAFAKTADTWSLTFPVQAPAATSITWTADSLKELAYKEKFEPASSGAHSPEATGTQHPRNLIQFTDKTGKEYSLALGKRTAGGIFATLNAAKTIYILSTNPLDQLDQDPQEFRNKNIKDIPTDKITALTVKHSAQSVTLAKSTGVGEHWLINAPISARANSTVITEILNQLKSINAVAFSDMTPDMPATGLNPPVDSVTAYVTESPAKSPATAPSTTSQPGATPITLNLGYYTDLTNKQNVYASLAGSSEVFTLPADAFTKLNRELKDLRDPSVTPAAVGEATDFTITIHVQPPLRVTKKDGKWSFTTGAALVLIPGDPLAIGNLLGDISHLRAINFVDNAGNLPAIGLQPPQATIELTVPNQSQHEVLLIGKPESDVSGGKVTPMLRQGESTVYLVPSADVEKILPTPLSLRDKEIERLSSDRIRSITIAGPAAGPSADVLEREGASWKIQTAGKSANADDEKITNLLADFTPLTATKFLAEKSDVPAKPDLTVTLSIFETPTSASTAPAVGPVPSKTVTRTLKLYKSVKDNQTTWKALWDGPVAQWTFEPATDLITHVTKENYAAPATQPATAPTSAPAK